MAWVDVKFMIFDAPLAKGDFTQRLNAVKKSLAATPGSD